MNAIQRTVRGDWPALHRVSTDIPNAAAAFYTDSILASSTGIMTICLGPSKAVFGNLRRRCGSPRCHYPLLSCMRVVGFQSQSRTGKIAGPNGP